MPVTEKIRVVIIDDHIQVHKIVDTLLKQTPDIKLVGQGANGQDALHLCKQYQPDVVLMDVVMPVMGGVDATRILKERYPDIKVLVMSSFRDNESVHAMVQNGAEGYITKESLSHDLVEVIRTTFQGKMVFSRAVIEQLVSPAEPSVDFHLTDRELEVLVLMAEGFNMPEIAEKLFISPSTVKFHSGNICDKLGVKTRSEALIVAAKNNLV